METQITLILIPVKKPTPLNQCGQWSIVYPPGKMKGKEYVKSKATR